MDLLERLRHSMTPCAVLFLLVGMSTVACYQPVDLNTGEAGEIPWVHCILSPDSTQWLELRYLSFDGTESRGINDAEISLYKYFGYDGSGKPDLFFLKEFKHASDGLWRIDSLQIESARMYYLSIRIPGMNELWAQTTTPSFDYHIHGRDSMISFYHLPGLAMKYGHHSDVCFFYERDEGYCYEYTLDGRHYTGLSGFYDDLGHLSCRLDHPRYQISDYRQNNAIWIYKVGWSADRQDWFIEDMLTCNKEDCADSFNKVGLCFTESEDSAVMKAFPETQGQPLHYRYLRFPAGSLSSSDTISVSGNFSGPHYGDASPASAIDLEISKKIYYATQGIPYDNIFTTGHAGYVNFKSVSYEYDRYLKDVAQFELLREMSSDIIGIYNNTNTYTNIHGGTGIFGAEVNNKLYWSCGVWIY